MTSTPRASEEAHDQPLFHIALVEDWIDAFRDGEYRMSTRGMTLDTVGFIHLSTRPQLVATANRFYGDLEELTVLTIDPARLSDPVRFEPVPDGDESFPHLYGPLPLSAVLDARLWHRGTDGWTVAS
ncbi:MAG: DUF952 domain-containing protein [Actinomycetota bacterium]